MLKAINLSLSIGGKTLVDDVSFDVHQGEVVALIGPNGAGKTCVIRLLSGDMAPTKGSVELMGQPLPNYSIKELAQTRSVMPQVTALNFPFTAAQVVLFGRNPHLDKQGETLEDHEIVRDALSDTEMSDFGERNYLTLSGGEKARVNLARVLAQRAPIVFLDEPISHVDPRHQHRTLRIARGLAEGGASVVVVLHDLNLAATYADRVGIMDQGQMRAIGTPEEVLTENLLQDVFQIGFRRLDNPDKDYPLLAILPDETASNPSYLIPTWESQ